MPRIVVRKLFAGLCAFGIAASIGLYVESLSGTTTDERSQWVTALVVGAILVQIPMLVLEHASLKDRTFFWKGFARGVPRWAVFLVKLCWAITLAHFAWFFIKGHHGVPVISDGQFILSSRGRIVKVLTQSEYLNFKADELRIFAALMFACYLAPTMYWWFPRNPQSDRVRGAVTE